ncbi:MAG: discoidin domain-containing protein, partial [Phycisphaerae bacterium]|nr:discoidin domain-containing protein [Phycisphaerae bacterium]
MYRRALWSFVMVSVLALTAAQTQGSPYDRVAYWDSTYATSWAGDGIAVRDALVAAGYRAVNAAELKTWMEGHIADKNPSVVVFCRDDIPSTVAETETATCTLRRYLDAGGKVVWYSDIPLYYQAGAGGGTTTWGTGGSTAVLGFNAAGGTWDVNQQVKITEAGARWGLTTTWSTARPMLQTATTDLEILATAPNGNAAGWVKHYVAGDTFRGFVRIDDHSGAPVNMAQLIAVAEYYVAFTTAVAPVPADGATDVPRDATMSWAAGQYPSTHDVYLGTTFADVNGASRTSAKSVLVSQGQADATFDPPGSLAYGQTYYWRIDEVNKAPDGTIYKGGVWSFTAEPYGYPITKVTATASSAAASMGPEKTIDGSGLTGDLHGTEGTTMWMTSGAQPNWIQYQFDKVYKVFDLKVWNSNQLIEAFLGFGAKSVTIEYSTDGTTWTALANVPEFARAPGLAGYAANTTVNFGGVMAKYVKLTIKSSWGGMAMAGLSEVRFSYVPVQAFAPQPATAATGVSVDPTLTWRPGREAGSHKVYLGTDPNAVANGTVAAQTVTDHAFTPGTLNFGATYYWKVDEANAVTYPGDVWSFTTAAYGVVDDFESYNDDTKRIYDTWTDGLTDGKSGSQVGYDTAPFAETTMVHGGTQSMPLKYDNTAKFSFSEAVRTFAPAQNWSASGIQSLSLYFQGAAANTGGQLYLKINSTKVSYTGSAGDLAKPAWTP